MSVRIMTQVWELDLPDSQKIVLLALADAANDEGGCWPSIATIARKSSKSERTVQSVIRTLCEAGHMERIEQPGHRSRFVIHPRKDCTPAKAAPPQGSHPTPAAVAGHPRNGCTQTQKNHNITSSPLTPRGGGRKIRLAISEDWQVPAPGTLPAAAQACAAQWPAGAYAAQAEAFAQYHRGTGSRRADWAALWAAWVARNHEAVMRQAKAGLGAPTAPTAQPGPAAPIEHAGAKRHETARSAELHDALREMLGRDLWAAWIEPAALLFHDDGLRVVATSAFRRDQIEDRHLAAIRDALSVIGAGVDWVKVESEPAGKRGRQAA